MSANEPNRTIPAVDLIVTRHPALRQLLMERGCADEYTRVIDHVEDPNVLAGLHVAGVLPLRLAVYASLVSEVEVSMTLADREAAQKGDLPIERLREIAGPIRTYVVQEVK